MDEALHVASVGWLRDPGDTGTRLRGALVALLDAGMLTAPPADVVPQLVRELPEPARGDA